MLSQLKRVDTVRQIVWGLIALLLLGATAGFYLSGYYGLPDRMTAVEEQNRINMIEHDNLRRQLDEIQKKLDQTLCILTQDDSSKPLDCIR